MASAGSGSSITHGHRTVPVITASAAAELDRELMASPGFSVDQLMELAGLAVATAVHEEHGRTALRVLVACGPGNNGGDGLVAARHLRHFGHAPTVLYPKSGRSEEAKRLYGNLTKQLDDLGVPVLRESEVDASGFDVVVDALFGFGFRPPVRAPFDGILSTIRDAAAAEGGPRVVSVDVPSGWPVDSREADAAALVPSSLVALSAPKPCTEALLGKATVWLGGRFIPDSLARRYGVDGLSSLYEGSSQIARLFARD